MNIFHALRDSVQFVQFKTCEKHPWRTVTFSLTKSNTPSSVFFTFKNCTNGTKSRKASDINVVIQQTF